jgi:hypothetical protein
MPSNQNTVKRCFLCNRSVRSIYTVRAFEHYTNTSLHEQSPITVQCCKRCVGYRPGFNLVHAIERKLIDLLRKEPVFYHPEVKS